MNARARLANCLSRQQRARQDFSFFLKRSRFFSFVRDELKKRKLMKNRTLPVKTRILFLITLLCAAMASVQHLHAATITVTSTADSGPGTLRQALALASNGDTIEFNLSRCPCTITLTSGELLVNKNLTINGPRADTLAVDANHIGRVFHVTGGVTATIAGLTITNGVAHIGGGIYNERSTLTVSNCTLSGNETFFIVPSNYDPGGSGIYNDGLRGSATLSVLNSTLSGNSADRFGGGIYNDGRQGNATLSVSNTTLSGNSAGTACGGILNNGRLGRATLSVLNSTLSDNSAPNGTGGIFNFFGSAQLGGNIFNTSSISATRTNTTSLGYNLSSDNGGGYLNGPGDQIDINPLLGPLQNNGGPTFTHALLPGSPATNAGNPNFNPPPVYDQRGPGFDRVVNGRIDIGSFELQPMPRPTPTPRRDPSPTPRP
jgi:hypothetical protein